MNKTQTQRADLSVIAECPLLSQLDAQSIETLQGVSIRRSYTAGQTIFRQGDPCPGLFVVDKGLVRIARAGVGGQEHVLHLCGPQQSFAEVAVFANFTLPANAMAVQATECVIIQTEPLQQEIASNHALCQQLLAGMAMWTHHFVDMLNDLVMRDAIQRVARLLCDAETDMDGDTVLPGPKKDLANHLNLSSETFSRVLRQLSDRGLLKNTPNKAIRICDLDALRRISQGE